KSLKKANHSEWYAFNSKLNSFLAPWPATLAREVLTRFRLAAKEGIGWHLHSLSQSLLLGLPPALLDDATRGWALDQYGVSEFVEAIAFRRDALLALSQS
ncbi:MAG: hypothetical protein V4710_23165, partial [Verrucomicrobiota bacterium]